MFIERIFHSPFCFINVTDIGNRRPAEIKCHAVFINDYFRQVGIEDFFFTLNLLNKCGNPNFRVIETSG